MVRPASKTLALAALLLLSGCRSDGQAIPPEAKRLHRGSGRMAYITQNSGTLYLRDLTAGKTIFRHELERGDLFVLNPEKNRLAIGNRTFERNLNPGHVYEVRYTGVLAPPREAGAGLVERPLRVDPMLAPRDLVVKEGTAPLVYLLEYPATVVVRDLTDNIRLASAAAPQGAIVAISDRVGIRIGGETVLAGPLPKDHRYAIVLEVEQENVVRSGVVRPERLETQQPAPPAAAPSGD